jgi:hypothetical protein
MPRADVGTSGSQTFPAEGPSFKEALRNKSAAGWRYLRVGSWHFMMYVFVRFSAFRAIVPLAYRTRTTRVAGNPVASALEDVNEEHAANAILKDATFLDVFGRKRLMACAVFQQPQPASPKRIFNVLSLIRTGPWRSSGIKRKFQWGVWIMPCRPVPKFRV